MFSIEIAPTSPTNLALKITKYPCDDTWYRMLYLLLFLFWDSFINRCNLISNVGELNQAWHDWYSIWGNFPWFLEYKFSTWKLVHFQLLIDAFIYVRKVSINHLFILLMFFFFSALELVANFFFFFFHYLKKKRWILIVFYFRRKGEYIHTSMHRIITLHYITWYQRRPLG